MSDTPESTPTSDQPDPAGVAPETPAEPDTFPRDYVERLREENAGHRVKAKRADALAARLLEATVAGTGRLADPTDLPYSDDLLDDDGLIDPDKVTSAVDDLLKRKPHLAARRPTGDVGQGARPEAADVSLSAMLRRGA